METDEEKFFKSEKRKKYNRKEEVSAIKCGLEELKAMNLVSSSEVEGKEVWVLKKGFNSIAQTVEMTPETCLSMSQIVNGFCDMLGNDKDRVDPSTIEEKDIKNLIFCCAYLMEHRESGEGQEEQEEQE
jgi:hypothetical protein